MDVLGLDFGTSNTVAVLASDGRAPRVVAIDGIGWLPSGVFVESDGALTVGREAERRARTAPERFEPHPKRRIDDGEMLLGVRVVPVVDAIAAVLRRVADEVRRQLNGRAPDAVHLTHPAAWGVTRTQILKSAAERAGLGERIVLIPEPVAAATHFASLPGHRAVPGSALAVYDLGGGTLDVAVVALQTFPDGQARFTVAAENGVNDLGGVDFDQAVLDHLGRTASSADPARWQAVARPRTAGDRRAALALREDGRAAKETLSRLAQADVPLPEPFEDTLLTRQEFEGLIRPLVARSVDVLDQTIRAAGRTPDGLLGVYLVGGSSRIPLIASHISERLGIVPITLDQPETSVAMGAALAPAGRPGTLGAPTLGPPSRGPMAAPPRTGGGPVVPRPPAEAPRPNQRPAGPPPVAPGPPARKRNLTWAVVAAVVVLIATVTTIVIANSGSDTAGGGVGTSASQRPSTTPSTTPPPTTESAPVDPVDPVDPSTSDSGTPSARPSNGECSELDDRGLSDCMRQLSGTLIDGTCTSDLSTVAEVELVSFLEQKGRSWALCSSGGPEVLFTMEMVNQLAYNQLTEMIVDRMVPEEGGSAVVDGVQISYIAGVFVSDSGGREGAVIWGDDKRPALNYATTSQGTNATWEQVRDHVEAGLGTTFVPAQAPTTGG